jgi:hypothetical protein
LHLPPGSNCIAGGPDRLKRSCWQQPKAKELHEQIHLQIAIERPGTVIWGSLMSERSLEALMLAATSRPNATSSQGNAGKCMHDKQHEQYSSGSHLEGLKPPQ